MWRLGTLHRRLLPTLALALLLVTTPLLVPAGADPQDPARTWWDSPQDPVQVVNATQDARWTSGIGPGAVAHPLACLPGQCQHHEVELALPHGFWEGRDGGLEVSVRWVVEQDDLELHVYDDAWNLAASSTGSFSTAEGVLVDEARPGSYHVIVSSLTSDAPLTYQGLAEVEARPAGPSPDEPGTLLEPNLVAEPPTDLHLVAPAFYGTGTPMPGADAADVSCYPDETVEERVTRCLRFSQGILNSGEGDLELRVPVEELPNSHLVGVDEDTLAAHDADGHVVQRVFRTNGTHVDRAAGPMEFHPAHGHFHYRGLAGHVLHEASYDEGNGSWSIGEPLREGSKKGFCMEDVELAWWDEPGNSPRGYSFPKCNVPSEREDGTTWMVQGISRGWTDVYTWDLPDQYVDVGGLADGTYALVTTVDPGATLLESTRDDNTAWTVFELTGDDVTVLASGHGSP